MYLRAPRLSTRRYRTDPWAVHSAASSPDPATRRCLAGRAAGTSEFMRSFRNGRTTRPASVLPAAVARVPALPRTAEILIALSIFFAVSKIHGYFVILVKLRLVFLLMGAVVILLVMNADRWRPDQLMKQRIPQAIAIITTFAVAGLPFSIGPGRGFMFLRESFLTTLVMAVSAWALARSPRGMRLLAKTLAMAGAATCLMAILVGNQDSAGRLSGAFTYDPNDLALIVTVTIPLLIWWSVEGAKRARIVPLLFIPVLLWVLIQTGSRGGFLGTATVVLGLVIISSRRAPRRLRRIGMAATVIAIAATPLLPRSYTERMTTILAEDDYNMTSPTGRKQVWLRGLGYAAQYPVFGVGIANFNWAEGTISSLARNRDPGEGIKFSTAHNSYVLVLAELGIVAGAVFSIMILRATWGLLFWHRRRRTFLPPYDSLRALPPLFGLSFAGFAVSAFFLSFSYYDILYVMLALASCILAASAREGRAGPVATGRVVRARRAAGRVLLAQEGKWEPGPKPSAVEPDPFSGGHAEDDHQSAGPA